MRYVTSDDNAVTWSVPLSLDLPKESFTKWRLALGPCDTPHVLISTWTWTESTPVGHILYATLRDSGWTPFLDLLPGRSAREIDVAADRAGSLHFVASVRRAGATGSSPSYDVMVSSLASAQSLAR